MSTAKTTGRPTGNNESDERIDLDQFLNDIMPVQTADDVELDAIENARVERRKGRVVSPGPWSYEDTHDACCGRACTPDGCHETHRSGLYRIVGPDWYDYDVVYPDVVCNEADASLIAAAPDLYAALKMLLEDGTLDQAIMEPGRVQIARAALQKADGA